MRALLATILIAACGGGGGGGNGTTDAAKSIDAAQSIDAPKVFMDAPPTVPATIIVSGTANDSGQSTSTPLAGVVVAFFKTTDETTPLAMQTTGADGTYSLTITTGGLVVDGFLKATKATFTDNYLYPTAPLQADFPMADSNLVSSSLFGGLALLTGYVSSDGIVIATILDASNNPVMGATVTSTPASGEYRYSDGNGEPTATTSTNTDGVGFYINLPATQDITISAAKSGITFKSHVLKAHANALTTTIVTP